MISGGVKDLWLQGFCKWFSKIYVNKGKHGVSMTVHTGARPIFVVLSYDYIFGDQNAV